jgi:nucleoside-diphosphate-sugar epimerase
LVTLGTSDIDRKIVNVASGHGVTVEDLVTEMSLVAGMDSGRLEYAPADWTEGSRRVGESFNIKNVFGWEAVTSLRDGLESTWNWMSRQ